MQALNFDLIAPTGGEICGGSLREDSYDILYNRIKHMENLESLNWLKNKLIRSLFKLSFLFRYLDLRSFGNVSHGGFGLGLDRLIQTLTGVKNIKDVVTFPRWTHHCDL